MTETRSLHDIPSRPSLTWGLLAIIPFFFNLLYVYASDPVIIFGLGYKVRPPYLDWLASHPYTILVEFLLLAVAYFIMVAHWTLKAPHKEVLAPHKNPWHLPAFKAEGGLLVSQKNFRAWVIFTIIFISLPFGLVIANQTSISQVLFAKPLILCLALFWGEVLYKLAIVWGIVYRYRQKKLFAISKELTEPILFEGDWANLAWELVLFIFLAWLI